MVFVWFPGSRLGTSMVYRLGLNAEAEPRVPCVPRREPGNENGARVGRNDLCASVEIVVSGIPEIFVLRGLVKDVESPLVVLNVLNDFVRTSSQSVKVAFVSVLLTS